jgi:hypothetical protein
MRCSGRVWTFAEYASRSANQLAEIPAARCSTRRRCCRWPPARPAPAADETRVEPGGAVLVNGARVGSARSRSRPRRRWVCTSPTVVSTRNVPLHSLGADEVVTTPSRTSPAPIAPTTPSSTWTGNRRLRDLRRAVRPGGRLVHVRCAQHLWERVASWGRCGCSSAPWRWPVPALEWSVRESVPTTDTLDRIADPGRHRSDSAGRRPDLAWRRLQRRSGTWRPRARNAPRSSSLCTPQRAGRR